MQPYSANIATGKAQEDYSSDLQSTFSCTDDALTVQFITLRHGSASLGPRTQPFYPCVQDNLSAAADRLFSQCDCVTMALEMMMMMPLMIIVFHCMNVLYCAPCIVEWLIQYGWPHSIHYRAHYSLSELLTDGHVGWKWMSTTVLNGRCRQRSTAD